MKFYVLDHQLIDVTPGFESLEAAALDALDKVMTGELETAIVAGMETDTFRTDVAAPLYVKVTALDDLKGSAWAV